MSRLVARSVIVGLVVLLGSTLNGCKGKKDSTTATGKGGVPAFFKVIPADTPYVFTSIEGYSDEMVDHYMATAQPVLEEAFKALEAYAAQAGEEGKAMQVLISAFKGKLDRAGLESIGLDLHGRGALYGLGLYPVMNWQLRDSAAFKGFVQGILDQYGIKPEVAKAGAHEYWILFKDQDVAVSIAFPPGAAVGAMTGPEDHLWAMEYALGVKTPERSLADDPVVLRSIDKYDWNRTHAGYVDVQHVVRILLGDVTSDFDKHSRAGFKIDMQVSDVCKKEIYGLVAYGPRMAFGQKSWTPKEYSAQFTWETEKPDLFDDLGEVATAVPGLDLDVTKPRKLMMGIGVDFEKAYELILDRLAAARKEPYQCEHLRELNEAIGEAETSMRVAPVPPAVRGLLGVQATLYDLELTSGTPTRIEAAMVVRHKDPESLVALAAMVVPELSQVRLPDDGSIVSIPLGSAMPLPGLTSVKAARKGQLLVVGMGATADTHVTTLVNASPKEKHLFAFAADYGWFGELMKSFGDPSEQPFDMSKLYRGNYAFGLDSDERGLHVMVRYADSQ